MKMLNDYFYIERDVDSDKTATGSLYLPDAARKVYNRGTVLAVPAPDEDYYIPSFIKVGDRVAFKAIEAEPEQFKVVVKLENLLYVE